MTALLELPTVRERVHPMPVATYHRLVELGALSEKVELIRGIIVTKMSQSPLHELVAQKLMKLLLARVPKGFEVRPERPLTLFDSEPEPDLSVVSGSPDDWTRAHPSTAVLVIEIAVTSTELDESKAAIYAEAGIPEYWLVRPERRSVTVYREPSPEGYRNQMTVPETARLNCIGLPGVEIEVASILPVRA